MHRQSLGLSDLKKPDFAWLFLFSKAKCVTKTEFQNLASK